MILPLFHIGGYSHFWSFFYVGGSNVIMPQRSFDPAATLKSIQEEKATDLHIVPTHLVSMLALPDVEMYDLSSLKRISVCRLSHARRIVEEGDGEVRADFPAGLWSVGVRTRHSFYVKKISSSPGQTS